MNMNGGIKKVLTFFKKYPEVIPFAGLVILYGHEGITVKDDKKRQKAQRRTFIYLKKIVSCFKKINLEREKERRQI